MKRFLATLAAGLKGPRKSRPAGRNMPRQRAKLGVELLDDRIVPSAVPNLTNAQFVLNVAGHAAQLQVTYENTATGQIAGIFNDPGRATTVVSGTVGAEAAGSTSANLFFVGFSAGGVNFSGTLNGTGTKGGYYGKDQLSGSAVEYLLPNNQPTSVSVTGNDQGPIINLTDAHFSLNFAGRAVQLQVTSESTATGQFIGLYTDPGRFSQVVTGQVTRATTIQNGSPVDGLTFSVVNTQVAVSFSGTVNGTGSNGVAFGNDQLSGSGSESSGFGRYSTVGKVSGNDLGPILNLTNAHFALGGGSYLVVASEQADGTFTGVYFDGRLRQSVVVQGQVGRATDLHDADDPFLFRGGEPIAPLSFTGQTAVGTTIHKIAFAGTVNGAGTNGNFYGHDYLKGTEWDVVGSQTQSISVIGSDIEPLH